MYVDKKVRGVSFYYKVKAFGLICKYLAIFLLIISFFVLTLIKN